MRGLLGERGGGLLDQGAEAGRVGHGEVGHDLPVYRDAGAGEAVDEAAVGEPLRPAGGVDAGDPQLPEVTLANAAVAVRVLAGVHDRFVRLAVQVAARAPVALRAVEYPVVALAGHHPALDSWHL